MEVELYSEKIKADRKTIIIGAFYTAYFNAKAQKKLSGSDLEKVLNSIDGIDKKMTDKEIFEQFKKLTAGFGGGNHVDS